MNTLDWQKNSRTRKISTTRINYGIADDCVPSFLIITWVSLPGKVLLKFWANL